MTKNNKIIIIISLSVIIAFALVLFLLLKNDPLPVKNSTWIIVEEGEVVETLHLFETGEFKYSTTKKDKYNLSECTEYRYKAKTKNIKLKCSDKAKLDEIKLLTQKDDKLVLKFGNEKKTFIIPET